MIIVNIQVIFSLNQCCWTYLILVSLHKAGYKITLVVQSNISLVKPFRFKWSVVILFNVQNCAVDDIVAGHSIANGLIMGSELTVKLKAGVEPTNQERLFVIHTAARYLMANCKE